MAKILEIGHVMANLATLLQNADEKQYCHSHIA